MKRRNKRCTICLHISGASTASKQSWAREPTSGSTLKGSRGDIAAHIQRGRWILELSRLDQPVSHRARPLMTSRKGEQLKFIQIGGPIQNCLSCILCIDIRSRSRSRERRADDLSPQHDPNRNNCPCSDCREQRGIGLAAAGDLEYLDASPQLQRQSSSGGSSTSSFAEQRLSGKQLRVFAKTVRLVYSGVKKQAMKLQYTGAELDELKSASNWSEMMVEEIERKIGVKIDWMLIKKESHPSGPLSKALDRADWHFNCFVVFMHKLKSILHLTFVVKSIGYHLSEKNRRHLPSAPRIVCIFPYIYLLTIERSANCYQFNI